MYYMGTHSIVVFVPGEIRRKFGASAVYGAQDGGDGNSSETGIYPWTGGGEYSVRMKSGGEDGANVGRELKYAEVGE
jgi:hypothetical protein